jgi:DNA-binding beta-propeller fold protein YncE
MRFSVPLRVAVLLILPLLGAPAQAQSCGAPAGDVVSTLALPGTPFSAIPSHDGCIIFVSITERTDRASPGHIAVVRRAGGQLVLLHDIAVSPRGLAGMAISHDGTLLAATDSNGVLLLDTAKLAAGEGGSIAAAKDQGGNAPQALSGSVYAAISPDDRLLFVSDEATASVSVYDLAKLKRGDVNAIGRVPVGNAPVGLAFSPDGRRLYTTSESALPGTPASCAPEGGAPNPTPPGLITVVDVARAASDPAGAVLAKVPGGCDPVRIVLSADGARAYVTARGEDGLEVFDTAKLVDDGGHALVTKVVAGKSPVGVAVADGRVITADSNRFAPPGRKGEWLSVIDPAAGRVLGFVPTGLFPREMFVTDSGRTLLVTNFNSSSLALVDLARLTPAYFAQQKTAKDADDAAQAAADAALKARIAGGQASPGTEAALRKFIAALQAKMPDYDDLAPAIATAVRASADQVGAMVAGWGPLQTVTFKSAMPQGADIFDVKFAQQDTLWTIALTADGKVSALVFRRAP